MSGAFLTENSDLIATLRGKARNRSESYEIVCPLAHLTGEYGSDPMDVKTFIRRHSDRFRMLPGPVGTPANFRVIHPLESTALVDGSSQKIGLGTKISTLRLLPV